MQAVACIYVIKECAVLKGTKCGSEYRDHNYSTRKWTV
jgi:hypothetical protein